MDILGSNLMIANQVEDLSTKVSQDFNMYQELKNNYKENSNDKTNIFNIEQGFKNFQPQTQIGKLLLLGEYKYFQNEYYKLRTNNPYTQSEGDEINKYLNNNINKEIFEKPNVKIDCGYFLVCHLAAVQMNNNINRSMDVVEKLKRKDLFELSHKEEMLNFYKLSPEQREQQYKTNQDPFSKNIW